MIKRALSESGCPPHIIQDLMENAHERRWPTGLSSLEIRQLNRRQYENYVCRRIPGKQAVAVMACDNGHMNPEMILEPGLIMIFAHGVEWHDTRMFYTPGNSFLVLLIHQNIMSVVNSVLATGWTTSANWH